MSLSSKIAENGQFNIIFSMRDDVYFNYLIKVYNIYFIKLDQAMSFYESE